MSPVQCVRCRNKHSESERTPQPVKGSAGVTQLVCPRCRCKSYFDLRASEAWCWASGLIEVGDEKSAPSESIVIARGARSSLQAVLAVLARHGRDDSAGQLLVPGVPEAKGQIAAVEALKEWVDWCALNNGKKFRHGVVFGRSL